MLVLSHSLALLSAGVVCAWCAPTRLPSSVSWLGSMASRAVRQGVFPDPTILDVSDVELVDLKFLEDDPVVVVQFTCQQLNCSRDKCGPGAPAFPAWRVALWRTCWVCACMRGCIQA